MESERKEQRLRTVLGIQENDLDWRLNSSNLQNSKPSASALIKKLSRLVNQPEWTEIVASAFPALLTAVLEESFYNGYENGDLVEGSRTSYKFGLIVTLSKLVLTYPSAFRFSVIAFEKFGSPLTCLSTLVSSSNENTKKKKKRHPTEFTVEDAVILMESVLVLLKVLPTHSSKRWSLKPFFELPKIGNKKLTWLCCHCVGVLLGVSDQDLERMKLKFGIGSVADLDMALEFQSKFESYYSSSVLLNYSNIQIQLPEKGIVHLTDSLSSIGGTLFKMSPHSDLTTVFHRNIAHGKHLERKIIQLDSTVSYIREIVLSLSSKFLPICLLGPIGCGKSSLISYTASLFGRENYPQFISIQMSDQIDSRLLLGSYHSTDLPGQFVWRPGSLTKAVLKGYWIVLEDMDSAPADVIALFDGLIDTHKLSVPGYGEIDSIHPDFRVFATCRTQVGKRTIRLGKQWKRIFIQPMTMEEMKLTVCESFPFLKPLADRLTGIFEAITIFQSQIRSNGRFVSLRDFLKFCRRIPTNLDLMDAHAAVAIFQEACDLFISSFSNLGTRREVAEIIGTNLNLLPAKAEYFCTTHKPNVNICTNSSVFTAGRYSVPMFDSTFKTIRNVGDVFSLTKRACNLMEVLAGCVSHGEPVLLIGETGVGKTSCVQYLSNVLHQKLIVVNLNRQSDSGDLLGGYKPVELKYIFKPIREEFESLFLESFNREANSKFLGHIMTCYANRRWKDLVKLMIHVQKLAISKSRPVHKLSTKLHERWIALGHQLARIELQITSKEDSPFAFSFIEGTLISAIKNGYWILLDEINLATPEMLQCLSGILDGDSDIHLWEKGDDCPIKRHPDFHLFAAMNPSTDVGKKDLPLGLRSRFTEIYVEELTDPSELQVLVADYLKEMGLSSNQIEKIVEFYLTLKSLSQTSLVDGMGKKPHFSLRTLCRALKISSMNLFGSASRSLYESFCLSFLTQLDYSSHPIVHSLVAKYIFGKVEIKSILNQPLPCPASVKSVQIEGYWIPQGDKEPQGSDKYILTPSVRRNLKDLARIVSAGKLPVLIQGETSVGKTSLIEYLARVTGNKCYRINNHQHTDLQEYVGSYQSDQYGKLVFTEGILVMAMRRGEWIILDELNLAPSEVLEALNRLLDDNRQLFITETGQTVTAHPRFMLFATQNPPGLYGGRKVLSRAFRNRFIELHFDEIPSVELETILHHRCNIPQSYSKKIIAVLKELQMMRKASAALEGKHGFATLRDLFRWAERYRQSGEQTTTFYDWDQHLADEGYLVLAGKVRKPAEAQVILEVLQKHLKRTVEPNNLFSLHYKTSPVTRPILEKLLTVEFPDFKHIVWTFQMRRLGVLIGSSLKFREPILLVGETGGGKTSIVQLLAHLYNQKLYAVNCHMHSEGSDFLGGLRPVRTHQPNDSRLFEWINGPLVDAMEAGGIFLADEISLADDSVLERINSVLEPERTLLLAEKGDETPKLVVATDDFHFIGTMNPGGDYGKKELSPALRNRLTEIWCEVSTDSSDIEAIVEHNLLPSIKGKGVSQVMISFVSWLKNNELGSRCTISIRDYLSWTYFINHSVEKGLKVSLSAAIHHGACLAFLDGLGSGTTGTENVLVSQFVKCQALTFLEGQTASIISDMESESVQADIFVSNTTEYIGIGPFFIKKSVPKDRNSELSSFNLEAPTTSLNALRVLRAMQLSKPILLEGSPGVGKTALVTALGKICNSPVVRINLSEQTDISDLFGADLPVEGAGGQFEWRDGPLLQALKNSSWILLDELNLASQSVLEGLNACLDHRGEIFVPELNRTFKIGTGDSQNRIFGCQNPVRQGGARKGLPKSFLNRFTQVFMDPLSVEDLQWIMQTTFSILPEAWIKVMAKFAEGVVKAVSQLGLFGSKGSPWDFNLRDLIRWATLIEKKANEGWNASLFVDFIYGMRMRTAEDSQKILQLYTETLQRTEDELKLNSIVKCGQSGYTVTKSEFHCGNGLLRRFRKNDVFHGTETMGLIVLQKQLPALEALTICLEMGWMPILVGPTRAGKTSLVKLLAELTEHQLKIMTVSPEMDTIELLGGFEQADIYRKIDETTGSLEEILGKLVKSIVRHKGHNLRLMDFQFLDLWSSLHSLESLILDGELLAQDEEMRRIQARLDFLTKTVSSCWDFLRETEEIISPELRREMKHIEDELEHIRNHLKSGIRNGAFEWVDSILVKAIRNGDWLLIDGANRCTAAVLDRLNSLVELDGSLLLSERGSIDGSIIEMKPHVNFRLILTMDPAFGEISRAMRNRGVEIYMPGPEEISSTDVNGGTSSEESLDMSLLNRTSEENKSLSPPAAFSSTSGINWFDLDALCRLEGIAHPVLRKELVHLHSQLYEMFAPSLGASERPHVFQIIETIRKMGLELRHGASPVKAVRNALSSVYLKVNLHLLEKELRNQIETLLSTFRFSLDSSYPSFSISLPGSITNFVSAQLYRVWKQVEILEVAFQTPPIIPILERLKATLKNEVFLNEVLFLTPFLRGAKADAGPLSAVIHSKFPNFSVDVGKKLVQIFNSLSITNGENDLSWDSQWKPHFLAKFSGVETLPLRIIDEIDGAVKTSIQLHENLFRRHETDDWAIGTLGFLTKNINQGRFLPGSIQCSQLFSNLWFLLEKFDGILSRSLRMKRNTHFQRLKSFRDYGRLWRRGMASFLWRSRLFSLGHSSYNPKAQNENFNSNLILVIQWIGEEVVSFLAELDPSAASELKKLVASCLDELDHADGSKRSLLESGKNFRKFSKVPPFSVPSGKASILEEVLELCFNGWSLSSSLKPERLISFLGSSNGSSTYKAITHLWSRLANSSDLTEYDMQCLEEVNLSAQNLKALDSCSEEPDELEKLASNVIGFQEYLRIREYSKNSVFTSPLLHTEAGRVENSLTAYLWWEECERHRVLFMENSTYEFLHASSYLPYFVSKILLENPGGKFRVSTLGSRQIVQDSMGEIASLLSKKLTGPMQDDDTFLLRLGNNFAQLLHEVSITIGNHEGFKNSIEEWLLTLEESATTRVHEKRMGYTGLVLLEAGCFLMNIGSQLPTVDPAVESEILARYLEEEINFFETWIVAQRIYESAETGQDLSFHPQFLHPSLVESLSHVKSLCDKLEETRKYQAHRPDPPNYKAIRQDLKQFSNSFMGSNTAIRKISKNVRDIFKGCGHEDMIQHTVTSCQIWMDAHRNFVKKIFKNFWYWDITAGFLFASIQAAVGLALISSSISRFKGGAIVAEKAALNELIQFPLPYRSSNDAISNHSWSKNVDAPLASSFTASLIQFINEVETEGCVSSIGVAKIHTLSANIASIWEFQEQEKQKEKDLEDAMYVFKGKERKMELSQDEQEDADMLNVFPDYVEDLIDLEVQNTLESGAEKRSVDALTESDSKIMLREEDVSLFLKLHNLVMNQVKTHWICSQNKSTEPDSDFVTPFLIRFQQGCQQAQELYKYFGKNEENNFIVGASVAVRNLNYNYQQPAFFCHVSIYDFYHDMNINEVHRLTPVMKGLKKRVNELLLEWPEHPSLSKILEIVARLESFRIDSPLMRFLTCLELLLSTAQEWESCAHQGVSISLFLSEVTEIIISWRKLELQCWKNLLEITFQREQFEAHRWWFHLYSVVMETINSPTRNVPAEFLKSLHQFMETSSLGQFETRLSYLYNIHCHLISIEQTHKKGSTFQDYLQPYIWNTFNYYKQFKHIVSAKLSSLRAPIEKKMKDFVKISRWNDANYFALKDSVQKNQKMLNKLVKEWREAMLTPVSTVLIADLSGMDTQDKFWKQRLVIPKPKLYLTNPREVPSLPIREDLLRFLNVKRLRRLGSLFKKSQNIMKSVLEEDCVSCRRETDAVEDLTGTIIDDVHQLQSIEVTEKSGEKRKKLLHNIHFRKRTSLADLFKILQKLNLSYHRGLVRLTRDEQDGGKLHRDFYMPPVDISAGWNILDRKFGADKDLVKSWDGCELYFQKCMARMGVMLKAFHQPSKELGPRIIERCKGFVVDLMEVAASQKELIAEFAQCLWTLRNLTGNNYAEGQRKSEFEKMFQEACRIEYETRQLELLQETIDSAAGEAVKKVISSVLLQARKVKQTMKIYVDSVTLPSLSLKLMEGRIDLAEGLESFNEIVRLFRTVETDTVMGQMFGKMALKIEEFVHHGASQLQELQLVGSNTIESCAHKERFGQVVDQVLRNVLLTFQKLNQLKTLRQKPEVSESEASTDPFFTDMKHSLTEEMSSFEMQKLLKGILRLMRIMREETCSDLSSVFSSLTPLLHQYSLAAEFYLTLYVQFHRSTCKLLSVILGIFATLGSKGFCLPADYEDEAAAEGQDMDAGAGMGMGEGETTSDAQDVSDRLESEDQLEDTLKEGESAPSADKELNDDETGVEMSEDFDGKQQDKEKREPNGEDDENDSGSEEEEDLEKEMGDVDDESADKLDDQMWGGSSDEEDENLNGKDEEQGKGSNRPADSEIRAKDPTLDPDAERETPEPEAQHEEKNKGKEINEQEDEEINDDQTDPYHGKNIPEEEPEEFDLPDDLNLDGAEPKDNDGEEEKNPYDLDAKETETLTEMLEDDKEDDKTVDENQVSEDEDPEAGKGVDVEPLPAEEENAKDKNDSDENANDQDVINSEDGKGDDEPEKENDEEHNLEEVADAATESKQKREDQAEPSGLDEGKSEDQTTVGNEKAKGEHIEEAMDTADDDSKKNDDNAAGLAESQDGTGHEGKSIKEDKNQVTQKENNQDASRRPGDTEHNRSLAKESNLQKEGANRLKTIDKPEDSSPTAQVEESEEDDCAQLNAELYQHVKDAEKSDAMTVDNSTKEQAEKQKHSESENQKEEDAKSPDLEEDNEIDTSETILKELEAHKPESGTKAPDKPKSNGDLHLENKEEPMEVEVEGEKAITYGAKRLENSVFETRFDLLEEWSREKEKLIMENAKRQIQTQHNYVTSEEEAAALSKWHELESKTLHLSQDLCEQLRLVLEPTQAARLRGDYKTGKRLNMRKVIPYIASGFRKDKIWLRRTQPSKREYQILIALDDSASMADNQSKQMAFSAVAVVARSLGLLEAGQLGVVGFGEEVQLLHPFEEPFTDLSGAKLIQRFTFAQRATRIAQLLEFSEVLFEQAKESHAASSSLTPEIAQLLLIVSDGRGVSHEGSGLVNRAVRHAREKNIFIVFIVVDNPENKDSILDIRLPIFGKDGTLDIAKYMDHFPFPFYLILRDLGALPGVLSDALRQWFELVTSSER